MKRKYRCKKYERKNTVSTVLAREHEWDTLADRQGEVSWVTRWDKGGLGA